MTFHKVVKAPAKRAHIRNYPHKKSEEKERRRLWLLNHAKTLLSGILVTPGRTKLDYYLYLRDVERELKEMGCFNDWAMRELVITAKHEHTRRRMGFF